MKRNSKSSNMPPLPSNDSVIRKKPHWPPPKPGQGVKGYPSIENPTMINTSIKSSDSKKTKTNSGSRRSLNTEMSRLARRNRRNNGRNNREKNTPVVRGVRVPSGSTSKGVPVKAVLTSSKKCKSKKCKSKKCKSKKCKSKKCKSKKYTKKK